MNQAKVKIGQVEVEFMFEETEMDSTFIDTLYSKTLDIYERAAKISVAVQRANKPQMPQQPRQSVVPNTKN